MTHLAVIRGLDSYAQARQPAKMTKRPSDQLLKVLDSLIPCCKIDTDGVLNLVIETRAESFKNRLQAVYAKHLAVSLGFELALRF